MSALQGAAAIPLSSLIDVNFLLINRIAVLAVTLLFFTALLLLERTRGQAAPRRVTAPIKLALFGIVLLYGEMMLSSFPNYRGMLEGIQTIVVLLCLAKLVLYLVVDIYLRLHTRRDVPSFLRDAVSLAVYLAAGIISLRLVFKIDLSAIITTTTVITATIAFAMQSTLSNALSGFSIQTDKLLGSGNWIAIKEKNIFGEIVNVGFRYTTLRALDNTLFMVPNSIILQNVVTYYGGRGAGEKPEMQVDVMLGYDLPPERAKELMRQVMRDEPDILPAPEPAVRLLALGDNGINYRLCFRLDDPSRRTAVQDSLYNRAWYAVTRAGYGFPFPHRQIINTESRPPFMFSREQVAGDLRQSPLFSLLDETAIAALAENVPVRVFGPGEVVVRQGEAGSSLFLVLKGEVAVFIDDTQVATISQDSVFGEMSLLTGEPRTATVSASGEVWLAEVTKELMAPLLRENQALLEGLSAMLAEREEHTRESAKAGVEELEKKSRSEDYLHRLKQFFRI